MESNRPRQASLRSILDEGERLRFLRSWADVVPAHLHRSHKPDTWTLSAPIMWSLQVGLPERRRREGES